MRNEVAQKNKHGINIIVSICLMVLYVATFLIDALTTKNVTVISFIMCTCTLTFIFVFFRKFHSMYYLPAVGFAFFALYLGTMMKFYDLIPIYDLLLHAASGILLTFGGLLLYSMLLGCSPKEKPSVMGEAAGSNRSSVRIAIVFSVFVSMAAAGLWEIWEYSGDVLFGLTSQGSGIDDTMTDIIAGSSAALVGGVILFFILKKKRASD